MPEESSTLPLLTTVSYIVEEREVISPTEVAFAWSFDSRETAEQFLLEQVRAAGHNRLYTAFLCLD